MGDVSDGGVLRPFLAVDVVDLWWLRKQTPAKRLVVPEANKKEFERVLNVKVPVWAAGRYDELLPSPEVVGAVTIVDAFRLCLEPPPPAELVPSSDPPAKTLICEDVPARGLGIEGESVCEPWCECFWLVHHQSIEPSSTPAYSELRVVLLSVAKIV